MNYSLAFPAAALLVLAACGGEGNVEQTADRLEEAADQSGPAAAAVLESAAEDIREGPPPANLGNAAQQAMQQAGNAQAATLEPQPAPPSMQAQPNRGGQQTPPPKIHTDGNSH